MLVKRHAALALILLPFLVGGCGHGAAADRPGLTIATSVAPLTSIASAIAGDRARVSGIIPEGADSHTYEPKPQAAELLGGADVIFLNGLALDDPVKALAEENKKPGAQIVQLGSSVLPRSQWIFDFSFPKKDGKPNPHLWTDPPYAIKYAGLIRSVLSRRDPRNTKYYNANYAAFARSAQELTAAMRMDQKTIPDRRLILLTYHDAYAYFGRTFGWHIIGAVQPRNFEDPSPKDVARLIEQIRVEKVPTIFGSEVYPSNVLEEIGRATHARYESTLRDDNLPGKPGDAVHSWLGLMRYDFATMVRGLGGSATHINAVSLPQGGGPDRAEYPQ